MSEQSYQDAFFCENVVGLSATLRSLWLLLIVADPARVVFTPTVQYTPRGLKGIIKCETDANPPITYITWKKDSRLFDPFNTAGIMAMLNGSLLIDRVSFDMIIQVAIWESCW